MNYILSYSEAGASGFWSRIYVVSAEFNIENKFVKMDLIALLKGGRLTCPAGGTIKRGREAVCFTPV
jgi:hypothetical protein